MNINWPLIAEILFHLSTLGVFLVALNYFVREVLRWLERRKIEGKLKTRSSKEPLWRTAPIIGDVYRALHNRLSVDENEHLTEPILAVIMVVSAIPFVTFGWFGQYLLMFAVPLAILRAVRDIVEQLDVDQEQLIIQQLPQTIDNLTKTLTRHDNIQTAMYEATIGLPQPMKGEVEGMVRRMNSRDKRSVLQEFRNKYSNPWVRSFIFILTSLIEDTERATALDNFKRLRKMITDNEMLANQSITEKRKSVIQNYIIAAGAFVISIGIMTTEWGRTFYFETGAGLFCLLGGYGAIFATIRMNINMVSRKGEG